MHPVAHAFGLRGAVVGVAGQRVLGAFAEAQLVEMLVAVPFPHDVAVPVHFEDHVVKQLLVGNFGVAGVAVGKDEGVAGIGLRLHARGVIAHGVALALEIVVIAGHPLRLLARVLDVFIAVELPDDVAVPVHLNEVKAVLHAVFTAAAAAAGQQIASGENLVGHAENAFPHVHLTAVHVHQDGAFFLRLKNRVAVPAPFGIVNGDAGGVDCRVTHVMLLAFAEVIGRLSFPDVLNLTRKGMSVLLPLLHFAQKNGH